MGATKINRAIEHQHNFGTVYRTVQQTTREQTTVITGPFSVRSKVTDLTSEASGNIAGASVVMTQPTMVSTSFNHPRLVQTDTKSIRTFLRLYDQYAKEGTTRAQQLAVGLTATTEAARPINLKYCVDPEWLESTVAFDFIDDVQSVESLTDQKLREFLDKMAEESKGNSDFLDAGRHGGARIGYEQDREIVQIAHRKTFYLVYFPSSTPRSKRGNRR